MLIAYFLSILFSYSYGLYAATNKRAERILIPVLDILQSVPILGFFPVAILVLIELTHGSIIGLELAAIFLIFTSQSWNMAFGVYQSIKAIPDDINNVSSIFSITGWKKFRSIYIPATIPSFVSNSMVSWAAGWYFLMAAEIITTTSNSSFYLPGLGSTMMTAASDGNTLLLILALIALILIILSMEFFIWKPLIKWSYKFKYDLTTYDEENKITSVERWERNIIVFISKFAAWIGRLRFINFTATEYRRLKKILRYIINATLLVIGWFILIVIIVTSWNIIHTPFPPDADLIPLALVYSLGRLCIAFLLSLAWTLPVGYYIGKNMKGAVSMETISQILGSVPATAIYPVILILILSIGGLQFASILLIMTGMQWYLLFNIIAGVRAIPADIDASMKSFGVKRWLYWKNVVLPAIFPFLITGSITAFGGGWNALIIVEYIAYGSKTYSVLGIGYLINVGAFTNYTLMYLSLAALTISVVLLNKLFWKRLYKMANVKYKMDL